jgi:GxxExxY protein
MPIILSRRMRPISQEEFNAIDHQVTGLAFAVHRDLGPFFLDEVIYQRELAWRCGAAGFSVAIEEPIEVSFGGFSATYFLDLLVNDCVLYELKTVATLNEHLASPSFFSSFDCDANSAACAPGVVTLRAKKARNRPRPSAFSSSAAETHDPSSSSTAALSPLATASITLFRNVILTCVKPSLVVMPSVGPGRNWAPSGTATVVRQL